MKKVILFIHGFAGHPNQFKLFYPEIPDGYDYHALLLAGHGGSVDDFGRASMKEWQNQVINSQEVGIIMSKGKLVEQAN